MCGIIGIIAKDAVAAGLLEGLRRLEYRGSRETCSPGRRLGECL
jgi:hypothetical protein